MSDALYAEVILPLAIPKQLTYSIAELQREKLKTGSRVIVPLGKQKFQTGIVSAIVDRAPVSTGIKEIESVIDDAPIVTKHQLKLWNWIAGYYMCTLGEVMNAALPSVLKLHSETTVIANSETEVQPELLNNNEYEIYELIKAKHAVSLRDIQKFCGKRNIQPFINSLVDKRLISIAEEVIERFRPHTETRITIAEDYKSDEALSAVLNHLQNRSPRQFEALMLIIQVLHQESNNGYVLKPNLLKDKRITSQSIRALLEKKIIQQSDVNVERLLFDSTAATALMPELTGLQLSALDSITSQIPGKEIVLLRGVTGSGKTEIYMHVIKEAIDRGMQVLFLVPEIAVTVQFINRLTKYFGNRILVYHSRQNNHEKAEIWNKVGGHKISAHSGQIILGARSSVFLPFVNLALIVIDEEHDSSFKQQSPAPRYHARDTAIFLAKLMNATTLLGSASPSIESYANAKEGKYGLVELNERYGNIQLPAIELCNMEEAARKRKVTSVFSNVLIDSIDAALKNNEQVIVFQNRRGFAPLVECTVCQWIPHCKNCSITLTYHKAKNQLLCHYCGYHQKMPVMCEACGSTGILHKGIGTEKIEENLSLIFPDARIKRLDLDATRSKHSFQRIINEFEQGNIDILVGTQMITKGLDFDNVSTVGIINADQMLNFPDFRANERSFQLMLQVSGRSGRKKKQGKVLIQTNQPGHWVIQHVLGHDYKSYFGQEMLDRQKYFYPPVSRLIEITMKGRNRDQVTQAASVFEMFLKDRLGKIVKGPAIPNVEKIKNDHLLFFLLKFDRAKSASFIKSEIEKALAAFMQLKEFGAVKFVINVDPV